MKVQMTGSIHTSNTLATDRIHDGQNIEFDVWQDGRHGIDKDGRDMKDKDDEPPPPMPSMTQGTLL